MHITSLYGSDSIGCFGDEALEFIDFLSDCGFEYWQVLPFCMADDCNSPYKSYSAFAGNPYFVDIRILEKEGYLTKTDIMAAKEDTPYSCEYEFLQRTRMKLLRRAASRASFEDRQRNEAFVKKDKYLAEFCEFMARRASNGDKPWYEWTSDDIDEDELFAWQFIQYHFMKQWSRIHDYAASKNIKIIGDIPIYVAYDSCDVWANMSKGIFDMTDDGKMINVAGCPPDYFAEDGQLWGNPLYNWDEMKKDGYTWWCDRISHMLDLFDGVRIDHFRGFESYWSIPANAKTAREGRWKKGPGMELIHKIRAVANVKGKDPLIIAEDLGDITPEVKALVDKSGFPGMRVLQFAFLGDRETPHLPHNYENHCVAYTGTHDNNTLLGYIWEMDEDTRRTVLEYCGYRYSGDDWDSKDSYDAVTRTVFSSAAGLVILPIQDVFHYGADTRMNIPGKPEGNWRYRITREQLMQVDRQAYKALNYLYGRC